MVDDTLIGRIFREESGRSVATLIRVFADIDLAEDAVQEAFAIALRKWPLEGLPPNPGGWITTTARNRAFDHLRREARGRELMGQVLGGAEATAGEEAGPVQDDRLRIIFTCCHPALSTEAQVRAQLWTIRSGDSAGLRGLETYGMSTDFNVDPRGRSRF